MVQKVTRRAIQPSYMDEDVDADEVRDLAGVTLTAVPMADNLWASGSREVTDARQMARDRLEGRRGGGAGAREVPPLDRWPLYEATVADLIEIGDVEAALKDYKVLAASDSMAQALLLVSRWRMVNSGRSLSFTETGAAKLSSSIVILTILTRQLQGIAQLFPPGEETANSVEELEAFLSRSDVDEWTANELRTLLGNGRRLGGVDEELVCNGVVKPHADMIVGVEQGSALALWSFDPDQDIAKVDFCIGHDCLGQGPFAEGVILRMVAAKAAKLGAKKLRCRARFTEDGKLFAPPCFEELGFARINSESWEEDFVEDSSDGDDAAGRMANIIAEGEALIDEVSRAKESVPGLRVWLTVQGLEQHIVEVNAWCEEMGAATMDEVVENREDLADHLGKALNEEGRFRLLERKY